MKKLEEEKDRLLIQVKDLKEFIKTSEDLKEREENKKETKNVCNFNWKEAMENKCNQCDFKSWRIILNGSTVTRKRLNS